MPDAVMAATLQNIQEADDIGLGIGVRIFEAVPNAGLGGEVDNAFGPDGPENLLHRRAIRNVSLDEFEFFMRHEPSEAVLLQPHIVIGVQVIDSRYLVTAFKQYPG